MGYADTAFDSAHVAIGAAYAVPAVYTPLDGDEAPVSVVIERDLTRYGDTLDVSNASAIIGCFVSEVPLRPRRGSVFTLENSEEFVVDSIASSDGQMHKCLVVA